MITDQRQVIDAVTSALLGRFYQGQRVRLKADPQKKRGAGTIEVIEDRPTQPLIGYVCHVRFDDRSKAVEHWHHSWLEAL